MNQYSHQTKTLLKIFHKIFTKLLIIQATVGKAGNWNLTNWNPETFEIKGRAMTLAIVPTIQNLDIFVLISNDSWQMVAICTDFKYSNHMNTGLVRFWMVQMCPVHKWSGFRMVHHYFDICGPKPFENLTKISGFQMVDHYFDVCVLFGPFEYQTLKSPVFRWIPYLGVRYSDVYCSWVSSF